MRSRRLLVIITQEPTQSLAALNRLLLAAGVRVTREQQDVTLPLVIPLSMIMFDVLVECAPQGALAKEITTGPYSGMLAVDNSPCSRPFQFVTIREAESDDRRIR